MARLGSSHTGLYPEKDNYGAVEDHTELIDINWDTSDGHPDWMHANAIDYNPELDQIIISVPTFNEVWIIDHSTTTEEAAGHSGGNSGKGGDLLFRWGNPATFKRGTPADQKLFFQHDIQWVDSFLDNTHPDYGKLSLFNNRVGPDYSTANIFVPTFDSATSTYLTTDGVWDPQDFGRVIVHPVDTALLHSTGLSGFQVLPNNNALVFSGRRGYAFEVTPDNEIVWEYKVSLNAGMPATQGDTLSLNNNITFRMTRYPADYAGFEGRDLTPAGFLEINPNTGFCAQILPVEEVSEEQVARLFPNPGKDVVTLEWSVPQPEMTVFILDLFGRKMQSLTMEGRGGDIDVSALPSGVYYVQATSGFTKKMLITR